MAATRSEVTTTPSVPLIRLQDLRTESLLERLPDGPINAADRRAVLFAHGGEETGSQLLEVRHRAVVHQVPAALAEGMGILQGGRSDRRLAHVGQHGSGAEAGPLDVSGAGSTFGGGSSLIGQ